MYPYCMREEQESRRRILEIGIAVVALAILVACMFSDVPRRNLITPVTRAAKEREQNRQSFAELQTATHQLQARNDAQQTELVKITRSLESTRTNLAALTEGHNTTAARLRQFETAIQQANERLAKFSESAILQRITKERDDALTQSQQSQEQVRQLTLKLQRAGVFP